MELRRVDIAVRDRQRWPWCEVCRKPCDHARGFTTIAGAYWEARCHGDVQKAHVPAATIERVRHSRHRYGRIIFGAAFHPGGEPLITTTRGSHVAIDVTDPGYQPKLTAVQVGRPAPAFTGRRTKVKLHG